MSFGRYLLNFLAFTHTKLASLNSSAIRTSPSTTHHISLPRSTHGNLPPLTTTHSSLLINTRQKWFFNTSSSHFLVSFLYYTYLVPSNYSAQFVRRPSLLSTACSFSLRITVPHNSSQSAASGYPTRQASNFWSQHPGTTALTNTDGGSGIRHNHLFSRNRRHKFLPRLFRFAGSKQLRRHH